MLPNYAKLVKDLGQASLIIQYQQFLKYYDCYKKLSEKNTDETLYFFHYFYNLYESLKRFPLRNLK